MSGKIRFIMLLLSVVSCVEPYDFVIEDDTNGIVIEGILTNQSYNDTRNYPSDGRYFNVKISRTSEVSNVLNDPILGANVYLVTSDNDSVYYNEIGDGVYEIRDVEFKSICGVQYQLRLDLMDGTHIESAWCSLPLRNEECNMSLGDITYKENIQQQMVVVAGEESLKDIKGLDLLIDLPKTQMRKYYVWKFEPIWIYEAVLPPIINKRCWIKNNIKTTYLNKYTLHEDNSGGYNEKLVFIEADDHIVHKYSLLIKQFLVERGYFEFLNDIQKRSANDIIDFTPYNINSNFASSDGTPVFGYFTVALEDAKRWYFDRSQLSYYLPDLGGEACRNDMDPGVSCYDCLKYPKGIPSLNPPSWWKHN